MGRAPFVSSLLVIAALSAPAAAQFDTKSNQAPVDQAAVVPGADALTLLCKGTYYIQNTGAVPNSAPATTSTQPTQFTIKLSYASQYMDLIAAEWPSLRVLKENPAVIRSVKFTYDDDVVRAMFAPATGEDVKGTLFNMGLSKLAGDYKEIIALNRKTGDFTYPNTTGRCEKVEATAKENKF